MRTSCSSRSTSRCGRRATHLCRLRSPGYARTRHALLLAVSCEGAQRPPRLSKALEHMRDTGPLDSLVSAVEALTLRLDFSDEFDLDELRRQRQGTATSPRISALR